MMELKAKLLTVFLEEVINDPLINSSHIALYAALLQLISGKDRRSIVIRKREVLSMAKTSNGTYHKNIQQLHDGGYIHYTPSYNYFLGSVVTFHLFPETVL